MAFQAQLLPITNVSDTPDSVLGTVHKVPAVGADRLVYLITAAGDPYPIKNVPHLDLPAGLERVEILADSGDQLWTYIKNNSANAISRGHLVAVEDGESALLCERAVSAERLKVIGVAQHNIPVDSYGWILSRGVGVVFVEGDDGVSEGDLLESGATAGRADEGDGEPIAVALEDGPGASDPDGLILARIMCEVVR